MRSLESINHSEGEYSPCPPHTISYKKTKRKEGRKKGRESVVVLGPIAHLQSIGTRAHWLNRNDRQGVEERIRWGESVEDEKEG